MANMKWGKKFSNSGYVGNAGNGVRVRAPIKFVPPWATPGASIKARQQTHLRNTKNTKKVTLPTLKFMKEEDQ